MNKNYTFSENEEINKLITNVAFELSGYLNTQDAHIEKMNMIGSALSAENNLDKLLEMILVYAKENANADGGTLYLMNKEETSLSFSVVQTSSLNIAMGGTMGEITWPPLELYHKDGKKNLEMVAAKCALEGKIINIDDVYETKEFNFEGTKLFDKSTGFRSKSMLVIPMKNYENEIIGVCQLINKIDAKTNEMIPFGQKDIDTLSSLASQAAVAITNTQLIQDLRLLLESFIKSIASAIDAKSPYTGGHVRKVAEISMIVVNSLNEAKSGKYKDINYNSDKLNEIRIAALMHDVGKITTPEYVVDKSTKLETIFDRINVIEARYAILERDAKIEYLEKLNNISDNNLTKEIIEKEYKEKLALYRDDFEFLTVSNVGGEFMSDDKIERLNNIAKNRYVLNSKEHPLITEEELKNLSIRKGTLTEEERQIINNHATVSLEMLNALPFPKKLSRVPQIAGGHHEKLNGKGYPLGLNADQLSLESRVLALADIFEALTASDRPYKEFKTLSQSMKIIDFMVKDGELDGDLVQFFYDNNLHIKYAKQELRPEQLDI
jgi:HD-GYP domain-containing protein (c-di-GMP phosphodiesterase class II)